MSGEYEELDSFTENIIKRTQERQKLLNDETNDCFELSSNLSSNHSQSSLKSDVLVNDNQNNIKLNESQNESIVDSTSKQLFENLSKLSPNRKRVPLNQRLNSIARTYNFEDSENIDYIDDSHPNEKQPTNEFRRSPTKSIRQTVTTPLESVPKKRLLNDRLNQIARNYDTSEALQPDLNNSEETLPIVVETNCLKTGTECRSPTKGPTIQRTVETINHCKEIKNDGRSAISGSPVKKKTKSSENLSSKLIQTPISVSPVKKDLQSDLKEKLSQFGFQKTEPLVRPKSIYNSIDNKKELPVINGSTNVSAVRKQFEQNCKSEDKVDRPEMLTLKAKAKLFEKAIEAENEAKSKQYFRKRNALQVVEPVFSPNDLMANNRPITSNVISDETVIKRQKSNENMIQTKTMVANNILVRRQQFEEKLLNSDTTTANAYKKELNERQKEIESLKRPLKPNRSENVYQKAEEQPEEQNESYESVDDEEAQQTVCEAFQDIENYPNERSFDDSFDDNINYGIDSLKSDPKLMNDKKLNIESESPTKNRLYPELFAQPQELCPQTYESDVNPIEKPPRSYQPSIQTNTTPLRTISFYRKEKSSQNTTPSVQNVVLKTNIIQTLNDKDLAERNLRLQQQIDDFKDKVEETNRIAGQASQALNLCLERDEFKGSKERVEAEKILLLSGQRRIAYLNEIQRLKVKLIDKKPEPKASKGLLTLSDFKLQMKGDFIVENAKGNVHHFICLVNNGSNVFPTNLLNTKDDIKNGFLEFEFGFRDLNELSGDFTIVVHIYQLVATKEQLSHDLKYHIKRTPKKTKSTMKSPTVRSPGGPNAVMSTSFRLVGAVNINLKNYHKNGFRLENFDLNCPLEGTLKLESKLAIDHPFNKEGFFDIHDSAGYWNMRWVVLSGTRLAFWRFPEDVTKTSALVVIDLKNCINPKISSIPSHLSHICLRRNTIAIITTDNTNSSKNIFTKGGSIPRSRPIKLLMSADTKETCMQWSDYLTKVLENVRQWDVEAHRPYSEEEFEKLLLTL